MARFCPSRGFILDLGGGGDGGLLFHFILSKIVALQSEVIVKSTRACGTQEETPRPRAARFSRQNRELARAATYS